MKVRIPVPVFEPLLSSIWLADGKLLIRCEDEFGVAGNQPAGLGSSIFDVIAKGNWSLKPGPDGIGTCLHMIIPALELLPARGGSSVG